MEYVCELSHGPRPYACRPTTRSRPLGVRLSTRGLIDGELWVLGHRFLAVDLEFWLPRKLILTKLGTFREKNAQLRQDQLWLGEQRSR
jgi:hypothetical protein